MLYSVQSIRLSENASTKLKADNKHKVNNPKWHNERKTFVKWR